MSKELSAQILAGRRGRADGAGDNSKEGRMRQDWLQTAEEHLAEAREARAIGARPSVRQRRGRKQDAALLVIESVFPSGRRHNAALDAVVNNLCDAVIIAAAQAEAEYTGQRESFQLPDGTIGSVDADGNLFDERPPQG